jgi:hypothetical protein
MPLQPVWDPRAEGFCGLGAVFFYVQYQVGNSSYLLAKSETGGQLGVMVCGHTQAQQEATFSTTKAVDGLGSITHYEHVHVGRMLQQPMHLAAVHVL